MMHEIENLSQDNQGYVYWKGVFVEHFSYRRNEKDEEKNACAELAAKCRQLEAWSFPVCSRSVAWYWSWFENWNSLSQSEQKLYQPFFASTLGWFENERGDIAFVVRDDSERRLCDIAVWDKKTKTFNRHEAEYRKSEVCWHAVEKWGYATADMGQRENLGTVYATTFGVVGFIERHRLGAEFFGKLEKLLSESGSKKFSTLDEKL